MEKAGIYIHIPYCKLRCDYCSFVSCVDLSSQKLYVDSLIAEINERKSPEEVDTIYIGGGTPSMLERGHLTKIMDAVGANFSVAKNAEITIEANPDSCTAEFLSEAKAAGVNRLSLGLQSSNDNILEGIGRAHKFCDFSLAVERAEKIGVTNISADLMLGLPADSLAGVEKSIDDVLAFPIAHVSVYALKLEQNTPLYARGFALDEDLQVDMYDLAVEKLAEHGLHRYEVSNFARDNFYSRHNFKYWTRAQYLGFGVAAHSLYNETRLENTANISKYIVGNRLDKAEKIPLYEAIEEYIMLSLRTNRGIDYSVLKRDYHYDLASEKRDIIKNLMKSNLIESTKTGIKLAENAFYVMDSVVLQLI